MKNKLYFLLSHFSFQPNKRFFISLLSISQPNKTVLEILHYYYIKIDDINTMRLLSILIL